jgi:hypothetical protein
MSPWPRLRDRDATSPETALPQAASVTSATPWALLTLAGAVANIVLAYRVYRASRATMR